MNAAANHLFYGQHEYDEIFLLHSMFTRNELLACKNDSPSSHSVRFLKDSGSSSKEVLKLNLQPACEAECMLCMLCTGSNLIFGHGQHGLMLWKPYGCHLWLLKNSLSVSGHGDST